MKPRNGRTIVATLLAVGLVTAINLITIAVLYDAIFSEGPGLSENATQILTTAFGGIIGVLGGYVGFQAGTQARDARAEAHELGHAQAVSELSELDESSSEPI